MLRSHRAPSQPSVPSKGVRGAVKNRLVKDMFETVPGNFKILITDPSATAILNAAMRMHELMDHGITLVEAIANKRQPLPTSAALYLVAPTSTNIEAIIHDFATTPSYQSAHVFFTSRAPDALIHRFQGTQVMQYMQSCVDLLLDFHAPETLTYSFEMKYDVPAFFGSAASAPARRNKIDQAAEHLISLLQSLGETEPCIRFQETESARAVATRVSDLISHRSKNMSATSKALAGESPATVLVVDRSLDVAAVLLHELTYQAMLQDLMPLENGIYHQQFKDRAGKDSVRSSTLDEEDPVWFKYRHTHISELLSGTSKEMNQLLEDNPDLAGGMHRGQKLTELGEAVRQLPKFQEQQSKLSLHMDIAEKLYRQFTNQDLRTICDLEQRMVTGEASDGQKVGFKDLYKEMQSVMKGPLPRLVKHRLLMIFVITQGSQLSIDKREDLLLAAKLGADENHQMDALKYFNVATVKDKQGKKKPSSSRTQNDAYELSRYEPRLKSVVEQLLRDGLSDREFPSTGGGGGKGASDLPQARPGLGARSLRSAPAPKFSSTLTRSSGSTGDKYLDLSNGKKIHLTTSSRVVVCVLGGITYSEMRSMYELVDEHRREIVFGGTSLIGPQQFLEQLPVVD